MRSLYGSLPGDPIDFINGIGFATAATAQEMSGKEWRKYTVAWCIMLVLFTATQCMETYLAVSEDVTTEIRIFKHVIQAGLREVPWGKQKDVEKNMISPGKNLHMLGFATSFCMFTGLYPL